jgi:hypothetical protein
MTMNKKVQRALSGPGIVEVLLSAVLSLVLGVALAAGYLVFKPVSVVDQVPAADKREEGMIYYVQGAKGSGGGGQLLRKQQLFLEGRSIVLNESELNTWMASSNSASKKPADPKAPAANELNFHLDRGVLQIGLPYTVDLLGLSGAVIIQAQGAFAKEGDEFVYEPSTIYIGSLPAQRIPILLTLLKKKIYSAQQLPDDLAAAWKKLANVSIDGNHLRLTMPK